MQDFPYLIPSIKKRQNSTAADETSFDMMLKSDNLEMRALIELIYSEMINLDHSGLLYPEAIERNLVILNLKSIDVKTFLDSPLAFP